jgi:hypothetical protein
VRYLRLNSKTSLSRVFDTYMAEKDIKAEHTSPHTAAQNGGSEHSERVIVIRARSMQIEV